ncbi:MAG: hypothetical protein IT424_11975 [Pirellulales bacterium]|nr:hypothetical protein [Pirellulales bacterium]
MVAFSSSRRHPLSKPQPDLGGLEALAQFGRQPLRTAFQAAGSRRDPGIMRVVSDPDGRILQLKIGPWRVITASPERQIAEARQLSDERIAVRIERRAGASGLPQSEIWQIYDRSGRQNAAIQTSSDGRFAIMTNYDTRQAFTLLRNRRDELETVETWNI